MDSLLVDERNEIEGVEVSDVTTEMIESQQLKDLFSIVLNVTIP